MPQYNPNLTYTFPRNTDIRPFASYSGSIPHPAGNRNTFPMLQISPSGSNGKTAYVYGYQLDTFTSFNRRNIYQVRLNDMYGPVMLMTVCDYPRIGLPVPVTFPLLVSGSQTRKAQVSIYGEWA